VRANYRARDFEETVYDRYVKLILLPLFGELNTEEGAKIS